MSNKLTTIFNEFKSDQLNQLAGALITRNKDALAELREAQELLTKALLRHFLNGKDVHENYYLILEECSTQREFANRIGLSESVLSNDLRAYRALEERGVTTPEGFKALLDKKGLTPSVKMWEKLPTLLEDPSSLERDNRPKPERDLERTQSELQRIANESPHTEIEAEAKTQLAQLEDLKAHLDKYDPYKYQWDSPAYRKWCRDIGMCMITKKACATEFHHTNPKGGSGGEGTKLPDCFGFAINPKLHREVEDGTVTLTTEQITNAIIQTMALFIMNTYE